MFIRYVINLDQFCDLTGSMSKYAIREWRKAGGPGMLNTSLPLHEPIPSPTVSASRKKQKTSQSAASLSFGAPSPALHPSIQPSSSALKRGPPSAIRGKKSKAVS